MRYWHCLGGLQSFYTGLNSLENRSPLTNTLSTSFTCYIHFQFAFSGGPRNFYDFLSLQAFYTGLNSSENRSPLTNTLPTSFFLLSTSLPSQDFFNFPPFVPSQHFFTFPPKTFYPFNNKKSFFK